jgi:hypothetical protein
MDARGDVLPPVGERLRWCDLLQERQLRNGAQHPRSGNGRVEVRHALPEPAGFEYVGTERLLAR